MDQTSPAKTIESTHQIVDAPVKTALLLICEKCGKRALNAKSSPPISQAPPSDENPSQLLQQALKQQLLSLGQKNEIRSLLTSCMDLCPENKVSVCIVKGTKKELPSCVTFYEMPYAATEQMAKEIVSLVN